MIHLAFLWHMHQPYYRDMATGEMLFPWVRLHGTKDYWGMAALLRERPPLKATFNWVPCLVEQLQALARGEVRDRALEVARKHPDSLEEDEVEFMLRSFFRANREQMIQPYPRYGELLEKRGEDPSRFRETAREFSVEDLRDLQVWVNLAWFHRTLQRTDPTVSALVRKGFRFTEEEKQALLDRQREILGRVLDLYREMADAGQVELTTSPYYHPILPLLVDMDSARMAMPGVVLPSRKPRYAEDARVQIEKGTALHASVFGRPPRGMWPPEGSVCAEMVPPASKAGIRWMATDEGILGHSLGLDLTRDGSERLVMPHVLYKPYRFSHEGAEVSFVFRDRLLSDLIGFRYQRMGAREAVGDFLDRLGKIQSSHPAEDLLVAVVLDGENPWEGYPGGGVEFLKLLYGRLAETDWIRTTTPSEYLDAHPDRPQLPRLHAGSWIDSNFSIWIGGRDGNRAWERLDRAREEWLRESPGADPAAAAKARESLLAAEGSDWFWWFSNRFTSDEDENFDGLFRTHLANVYRFLGRPVPEDLQSSILERVRKPFSQPVNLLSIVIDGEVTHFFEWRGAGEYDPSRDYTSMGRSREKGVTAIRLGADRASLLLRVDLDPSAREFLANGADVRIPGLPGKRTAILRRQPEALSGEVAILVRDAAEAAPSGGRWAAGRILEISIPFAALEAAPGESFWFQLETVLRGRVLDRFPRAGSFEVTVPGREFDLDHWVV